MTGAAYTNNDPGTKSLAHLAENVAAAAVRLTDDQHAELPAAG